MTLTNHTTADMTLNWAKTRTAKKESVETSVKLTGAPDISWRRKSPWMPGRGRPYSIRFDFARYDNGPWRSNITIYAQRPESIVGDWFSPAQVIDMPQWLTDIIAEAESQCPS